jgi:hypothetical protein
MAGQTPGNRDRSAACHETGARVLAGAGTRPFPHRSSGMENLALRELTKADIAGIVRAMDEDGYGRIAQFFPDAMLADARRFVTAELERHGREYFSYIGRDAVRDCVLAEIGAAPGFRDLLARIYAAGTRRPAPPSAVYQVLRVLSGTTGLKEAFKFHYDAYVVTALMPIAIPTGAGEKRGDLVIYPKLRRIRSNVGINLVEKLLVQNPGGRRIARTAALQRLFAARVLRMEPGDLYLFWGYQSLHGNEPCFPTSTRATALFHFADPHADSRIVTAIQAWRSRREGKIRARAAASGGARSPA